MARLLAAVLAASAATSPLQPLVGRVVAAGPPGALVRVDTATASATAASGLADLARRRPLRPDDAFRVGSITKTFVAVVVLQLVAEHRLRLDDPVERWLPGLLPNGRRVTVRELLGHRSGLADYAGDAAFVRLTVAEPARTWTPRELVRRAVALGPVAPPGRRFAYASTNYVVLGLIVERVTGRRLGVELRRRLFVPLGLRHTRFANGTEVPGRHAHGYRPSAHDGIVSGLATAVDRSTASASWGWAAGAVVSDAPDLSRFFRSLLAGDLLPRRLLAVMLPARGARYGLGLAAFATPCGPAVGHTGNLLGYVSAVWASRDGSRRVVAMANAYPLSPDADVAFRRLLERAYCGRR